LKKLVGKRGKNRSLFLRDFHIKIRDEGHKAEKMVFFALLSGTFWDCLGQSLFLS
jgi:hypothetical protein